MSLYSIFGEVTEDSRPISDPDGRLSRLATLDPDRLAESLTFLAGYAPRVLDTILDATEPCPDDELPYGDDALEPYCTECDARIGIFMARGGNWLHYTGNPEDRDVYPYDPGHAPVLAWRPTPSIVVVAR
jgi:hypothetical protein